ncbi:hypothetical protein LZ554_009463 [Drepanopeziza brunnea f. sp. 'monogermtubi']|nr:hypothetical protein LZ554_009463 [Drepanopeziza brunnea f. sp. 'monogermtubi']
MAPIRNTSDSGPNNRVKLHLPARHAPINPYTRDERCFLPIQFHRGPKLVYERSAGNIIRVVKDFNFKETTAAAVDDFVAQALCHKPNPSGPANLPLGIAIGKCGIIDYSIAFQRLGPGSINSKATTSGCIRGSPLVNLTLTSSDDTTSPTTWRAVVLGRIAGPHQLVDRVQQSRWIVMLDEERRLWVLYADGIDKTDIQASHGLYASPYSYNWDTAFGAQKQFGQKVVLLGSIDEIPFGAGQELPTPQIQSMDWSTTFVKIDGPFRLASKPLVSVGTIKRLLNTDTSYIKLPDYGKKYMPWFRSVLGFEKFCRDLDLANQSAGLVIGRTLSEAAWCKAVVQGYKTMDEDVEQREGDELLGDLECLSHCLDMRREKSIFQYWLEKSTKNHGLELLAILDDDDDADDDTSDRMAELRTWVIAMLDENKAGLAPKQSATLPRPAPATTNPKSTFTKPRPSKPQQVREDAMDEGDDGDEDRDSVLVIRQAEEAGLIKTTKKDAEMKL